MNNSPPVSLDTCGTANESTSITAAFDQRQSPSTKSSTALHADKTLRAANNDGAKLKTKASSDENYMTNVAMNRQPDEAVMEAVIKARQPANTARLTTSAAHEVNVLPVEVRADAELETMHATATVTGG